MALKALVQLNLRVFTKLIGNISVQTDQLRAPLNMTSNAFLDVAYKYVNKRALNTWSFEQAL
jgi:hypothetical protein